jgi:uncharacterized membrane protein YcjF (UPF0283 family)
MDFWDFVWGALVVFFFAMFFAVFISVMLDVFRSDDLTGWQRALWVLALIVFPVVGVLIYVIVRGRGMAGRNSQAVRDTIEESVVSDGTAPADQLHRAKELLDAGAIDDAEYARLKEKILA